MNFQKTLKIWTEIKNDSFYDSNQTKKNKRNFIFVFWKQMFTLCKW